VSDVTRLLNALAPDDPAGAAKLLPLVYDDLRRLAAHRLAHEAPGQTLQPTALVHEAYLRLMRGHTAEHWDGRGHFFAAAAEAMRRILVENARRKRSAKHGGGLVRHDLDEAELEAPEPREDLLALDEALTQLAATDRAAADLVQLRYFGGLSIPEAARVLRISPRTANRLWTYARAWLHQKISGAGGRTTRPEKSVARLRPGFRMTL
jgi:RNA polymerase sigma factor (TIGR02999 family)